MKTLTKSAIQEIDKRQVSSPWPTFLISSIAIFMVSLDATMLYAAFKNIHIAFPQTSSADLSWVINAYTVVYAAMLIPAGSLSDRFGRKTTFLYGAAIFIAASMLCGLSGSAYELIAARVAQAFGAALLSPSSLSIVLGAFPANKRSVAVSLWGAVGGLAAAIGPSLGSLIVDKLGWSWAFYINLPMGLIPILLGPSLLKESINSENTRKTDLVGILLLIAGITCISLGLVKIESENWSKSELITTLTLGLFIIGTFCIWIQTIDHPLIDPKLFENSRFAYANLATFLFGIAFSMMFFGFFFFLLDVWHYSLPTAGLAVTPGPLLVIPFAVIAGKYAVKFGHRPFIVTGSLLFAISGMWFAFMTSETPSYLANWLPGLLLSGVGVGLVMPSLLSVAVSNLPQNQYAIGSSINQTIRQVGAVIGVALTILILGVKTFDASRFQALYFTYSALALVVALISLKISRN